MMKQSTQFDLFNGYVVTFFQKELEENALINSCAQQFGHHPSLVTADQQNKPQSASRTGSAPWPMHLCCFIGTSNVHVPTRSPKKQQEVTAFLSFLFCR